MLIINFLQLLFFQIARNGYIIAGKSRLYLTSLSYSNYLSYTHPIVAALLANYNTQNMVNVCYDIIYSESRTEEDRRVQEQVDGIISAKSNTTYNSTMTILVHWVDAKRTTQHYKYHPYYRHYTYIQVGTRFVYSFTAMSNTHLYLSDVFLIRKWKIPFDVIKIWRNHRISLVLGTRPTASRLQNTFVKNQVFIETICCEIFNENIPFT